MTSRIKIDIFVVESLVLDFVAENKNGSCVSYTEKIESLGDLNEII